MTSVQDIQSVALKTGRFAGFREKSGQGQVLATALLPDPALLFEAGEPVRSPWHSTSTEKVRIRAEGQEYFVKRFNSLGLGYRVKNMLRPSRALRSWLNGLRFLQAKVPTVAPVVCLEERFFGLLGCSYIIFPHLTDAETLLDSWPCLTPQEHMTVLLNMAEIIGRMHRQGIFHGDLNWRNIMVLREAGQFQLFLIDLDGCRYRRSYNESLALRDLKHFYRDMIRATVPDELVEKFRRAWQASVKD